MLTVIKRILMLTACAATGAALAQPEAGSQAAAEQGGADRLLESTAAVLWQPSMNVFRRFDVPAEEMFEFYGQLLGYRQLSTINVGTGAGVARFQAGAQELKLTRRVADRQYQDGGVEAATGLRLLTFFFADEERCAGVSRSTVMPRRASSRLRARAARARS